MRRTEGPQEWLSFDSLTDDNIMFRVSVSFLLSNYHCLFGNGCPGLLNRDVNYERGCCERGVTFIDDEDFENVAKMVDELTDDDCDNLDHVRSKGWYITAPKSKRPYKTRKLNDTCIFNNLTEGRAGCSFHRLALRTGRHHSDTKPVICWTVPMNYSEIEPDERFGKRTIVINAFSADAWGGDDDDDEKGTQGWMGFWCTDVPDAYGGDHKVYRSMEVELRKLMGDENYEYMAALLDQYDKPRMKMPAQYVNDGKPIIPLLIAKRFPDGPAT